jgi:hypothetical protein
MAQKIQLRRDTAANWTSANPILSEGEYGYETDTARSKIGDGVQNWNTLSYLGVATDGWTNTGAEATARSVDAKLKDEKSSADYGETIVNHNFSNYNRLTPRKLSSKFIEKQRGTDQQIRVCVFGDSLALEKPRLLNAELSRQFNSPGDQPRVWHSGAQLTGGTGADFDDPVGIATSGTFTSDPGDGFTYWPIGPLPQLTSGSVVKWVNGGNPSVDPTWASWTVYYVRENGAGTFNVKVGGATVQTINANNAGVALGSYTYTQASTQTSYELETVSGSIRIIGVVDSEVRNGVYADLQSIGGLALSNAMSSSVARGLFQDYLAAQNFDLFTWEMDDGSLSDLNLLGDILDNAIPTADKIFSASTPQVGIPTSRVRRDTLEEFCLARDLTYFFFDGWTPVAPWQTIVDLGWQGDGVHPDTDCQSYLAGLLFRQLGIDGFIYGKGTRPIRTSSLEPSQLGINTIIKGTQPDTGITFESDLVFSFDWTVKFPRVLAFQGDFSGSSNVIAQFSQNTAAAPNILPSSWKFSSATDDRSIAWSTAPGFNLMQIRDAANTVNGFAEVQLSGANLAPYTRATLPTSNNRPGTIIYVSDGSTNSPAAGTGILAYSDGSGPTVWKRISDNSIIS